MSSDSESGAEEPRRKRGKVNKDMHTKEMEKLARARGEEFEGFTDDEKKAIIKSVYSGRPKNERDTFLVGLIDRHEVARHRSVSEKSKQITSSYKYNALKGNEMFALKFVAKHT
ncbi:uncharacterized protein LOC120354933 [Nilaparvata lugens]|uniref:uncharacterized protein LOC120354933 n=1 Tax=Nilaparvata lugens TaxID=108931 RepID=UPI00193E40D2|nr:uncharacterized protein LOC120354933 [Nilaparvata lugens]